MFCWNCGQIDPQAVWWGRPNSPWLWVCDNCKDEIDEPGTYTQIAIRENAAAPRECMHELSFKRHCEECDTFAMGKVLRNVDSPGETFPPRFAKEYGAFA